VFPPLLAIISTMSNLRSISIHHAYFPLHLLPKHLANATNLTAFLLDSVRDLGCLFYFKETMLVYNMETKHVFAEIEHEELHLSSALITEIDAGERDSDLQQSPCSDDEDSLGASLMAYDPPIHCKDRALFVDDSRSVKRMKTSMVLFHCLI
ncbi:hypothetical protein V5O48_018806, partial [Marasmius crinis-equi]